MASLEEWEFTRGFNFMASAMTGGGIVLPVERPHRLASKIHAMLMGSAGVGLVSFIIATLGASLLAPFIYMFGLDAPDRTTSFVFGKLLCLACIVMGGNLVAAGVFGSMLSYLEPTMGWYAAFKAVASVALGGGVSFDGQGTPKTKGGQLFYVLVGVWATGIAAIMVAITGEPGIRAIEENTKMIVKTGASIKMAIKQLSTLVFLMLPIVLIAIMLAVASLMSVFTSWSFREAFWATLPATTGGAATLASSSKPPLETTGVFLLIFAASSGFYVLSVFLGLGSELMAPITEKLKILQVPEGWIGNSAVALSFVALVIISFVVIPLAVALFAIPLGAFLAFAENWEFLQGFWWCVAVQLGGGMQLTDASIKTHAGMIVGICVVAWSIGISIVTVGFSGAPITAPLMEALGLNMDKDEFQEACSFIVADA